MMMMMRDVQIKSFQDIVSNIGISITNLFYIINFYVHQLLNMLEQVLPHGTQSIRVVQRGHLKDCTRCVAGVRPGADPLHLLLGRGRHHHSAPGLRSANIWIDDSEWCC